MSNVLFITSLILGNLGYIQAEGIQTVILADRGKFVGYGYT